MEALVVSDRKKKKDLFRQLREYSNDNDRTDLKVRLINIRVKITPLCYCSVYEYILEYTIPVFFPHTAPVFSLLICNIRFLTFSGLI